MAVAFVRNVMILWYEKKPENLVTRNKFLQETPGQISVKLIKPGMSQGKKPWNDCFPIHGKRVDNGGTAETNANLWVARWRRVVTCLVACSSEAQLAGFPAPIFLHILSFNIWSFVPHEERKRQWYGHMTGNTASMHCFTDSKLLGECPRSPTNSCRSCRQKMKGDFCPNQIKSTHQFKDPSDCI